LDLAELLPPVPGGPMLANARGGGRLAIARLKNQKLDVQKVAAQVTLEPGVLVVPEFGFAGYGGAAKGKARFDYRDAKNPAPTVEAALESAPAEELRGAWTGGGRPLHGVLT